PDQELERPAHRVWAMVAIRLWSVKVCRTVPGCLNARHRELVPSLSDHRVRTCPHSPSDRFLPSWPLAALHRRRPTPSRRGAPAPPIAPALSPGCRRPVTHALGAGGRQGVKARAVVPEDLRLRLLAHALECEELVDRVREEPVRVRVVG